MRFARSIGIGVGFGGDTISTASRSILRTLWATGSFSPPSFIQTNWTQAGSGEEARKLLAEPR